jgi:RNA polymerase sigma-70 factor (ECF subfamily)
MIPSPPETRASLILRLPDAADVAAWDEVLTIYGPLVYRLALRQGLQQTDAEDLVQEVFTAIARSVSRWLERTDRGKFRAWLLRIARNTAINFLTRRPKGAIGTGGDDAARSLAEIPVPTSELSNQFDLEYRRDVFRWAAERVQEGVTEPTWQAFWLTQVEGRPIADAARQVGMSVGAVYIARSRVMARFRELVSQLESQA